MDVGVVTGIEANHKPLPEARKGMEICVKIESPAGEAPKMYGRHFDHTDLLVSKVNFILKHTLFSIHVVIRPPERTTSLKPPESDNPKRRRLSPVSI